MKVLLKDGAPRSSGSVTLNVSKHGNVLEVAFDGQEDPFVIFECYDGKLNTRVYHHEKHTLLAMSTSPVPSSTAPAASLPVPAGNEAAANESTADSSGTDPSQKPALDESEEFDYPDEDMDAFDAA